VSVLTVNLGNNSYDILIARGTLASLGNECASRGLTGSAAVITNPTVAALYADVVSSSLADAGNSVTVIEIPDGEEFKNAETLNNVYDELIEAGIDRHSFIVALGGGVVGDLAGYAAATYLRGVPFVQVPTTLLAQVDSSVGGKTAIDHKRGKNLIGAFYQPRLVLIDVDTLKTLALREIHAGLAEVAKYGVAIDRVFFEFLERNADRIMHLDQECLTKVIQRCCELKAQVVAMDEKETGMRAILNYGHTLGHAIETQSGYGVLVHGEAIAIGMKLAAQISMRLGYCNQEDVQRIESLLTAFGLSLTPPAVDLNRLRTSVMTDKKSRSGVINFICNRGIGSHVVEKLTSEQLLTLSGMEV
jgi:3-dehydroquinate synthase